MRKNLDTTTRSLKLMEFNKIQELKVGDNVFVGIVNFAGKMEFYKAKVVQPLFWNSDADEPDWEVETTIGFVDIYSIYEKNQVKNTKELYLVNVYGDSFSSFEEYYDEKEIEVIQKFFNDMGEHDVASYDYPLVEFEKKI